MQALVKTALLSGIRIWLLFMACFTTINIHAQFAPAAGKPGSTALWHDSSCFTGWAAACETIRGFRNIAIPDSGLASAGTGASATGNALQNGIISLGDGGSATLTFDYPIINGPGWDFAVFENSFLDTFLELAFVEVSSDGKRYVRFPAISLTDTSRQTEAFGYTYPEKIHNLAGKYRVGFGTPFDLNELADSAGIDINNITHVRIMDVVGSILPAFAQRDSKGQIVNDPWPTSFLSGGFDLDAVGVIHQKLSIKNNSNTQIPSIKIWPNPVYNNELNVHCDEQGLVELYNLSGHKIDSWNVHKGQNTLKIAIHTGMYLIRYVNSSKSFSQTIEIIR